MITALGTHTPYQAAHKALRKDPAIVAGLNAAHKSTYRTVSDIVLLICLETYFPERQLTHRTWPSLSTCREEVTAEVIERLRQIKDTDGTPITHLIVRAVAAWLPANVAGLDQFGGAKWHDPTKPVAHFARPEGMSIEKYAQDLHALALIHAAGAGEITMEHAVACIAHHRLTFFETSTAPQEEITTWPI